MQTRSRRRSIFSNPREQARIIGVFALLTIAFAAVNWYVSIQALDRTYEAVVSVDLPAVSRFDAAVVYDQQRAALNLQLALFSVLTIAIMALGSLFLSHHIGGPIRQLSDYLRGVAKGDTPARSIRFRKYDFFHQLAVDFNAFQRKFGILSSSESPSEPPGKK